MLARDYLNLSLVRLNDSTGWTPASDCLTLVFPTSGTGHLSPATVEPAQIAAGTPDPAPSPACRADPPVAWDNQLAPGDVLVLNGASHGLLRNSSPGTPFAFRTFSLCLEHLFPLFAGRDVALLATVADRFKAPKHYPAASPLAVACHNFIADVPPQFDIDHRSQLLRAAGAVLAFEFKTTPRTRHTGSIRTEEHISDVLETLSATDIQDGSVLDLARKFGCTPRHLNRLFHQHLGSSVAAFKMESRLLKAASLLRDPAAKVISIAEQCGFNFQGQFSTRFKRRFGMSPGQWRKRKPGAPAALLSPAQAGKSGQMTTLGLHTLARLA